MSDHSIVSQEGVKDVIDRLGRDQNPQTRREATELVQAARHRGELGLVYAQAVAGQGLELLCDANDHDETSREALTSMTPRRLMERLVETPANSIQWRLAPVRVVIAALFSVDLLIFFPEHELEDDDGPPDEDEHEPEGATKSPTDDDDDEPEPDDDENVTHLFIDEFRKRFDELFERQDGHPPYREDKDEAREVELDGAGVVQLFLEGPADLELTRTKVEGWIADLLGEVVIHAQAPAESSSNDAPDKFGM